MKLGKLLKTTGVCHNHNRSSKQLLNHMHIVVKALMLIILMLIFTLQNVYAQTEFSKDGGVYTTLLNDLQHLLRDGKRLRTVTLDGKERRMFVSWVRDHTHTMKAYKYWEQDLGSFIEFFLGRQTPTGMYFDYSMSYKNNNVGQLYFTNIFDNQFYFVDVNNQRFFFRMPIEADLEYILVEGVYTYWQATGDTAFVSKWLPTLEKGLKYEMTDPLRWSKEYLMVMRPYSIDTWDFTSEPDSLKDNARLLYHIGNDENTPKGIMHGDNSGMYQACNQISTLYSVTGNPDKAREWDLEGQVFRQKLNTICWNGRFYSQYVPVDPIPSHIKFDPDVLSLSNTYTMNRGATTPEMAASIIETYREVGEKTQSESMAPWYGIYPPVEPQFGKYKSGEYVNGAIIPLVGGELTKAAFRYGYEAFAVQQLGLLDKIMAKNNRDLPGCINLDGTVQAEAIPDEWGQAAFVSALVEGLAGVVDQDVGFRQVELSPRWLFAGVNKIDVTIGYRGDGEQVKYTYTFDPDKKTMTIVTGGKFEDYTLRAPYPANTVSATATVNGLPVEVTTDQVNQSRYAVVRGSGAGNAVAYRFE